MYRSVAGDGERQGDAKKLKCLLLFVVCALCAQVWLAVRSWVRLEQLEKGARFGEKRLSTFSGLTLGGTEKRIDMTWLTCFFCNVESGSRWVARGSYKNFGGCYAVVRWVQLAEKEVFKDIALLVAVEGTVSKSAE